MSRHPVAGMLACARPVRDLARATRFYCDALGFTAVASPDDAQVAQALADAWGGHAPSLQRLRLGQETLLLAAIDTAADWHPPDSGATDRRFQHIAVITSDMAAAWQRLQGLGGAWQPLSTDGPQTLPEASGGVAAVKFRDPDGHPVELLAFPPQHTPPRWQAGSDGTRALTQGIDHSAITVGDVERATAFYRGQLGLVPGPRQVNRGPEQARLDGVVVPAVDVVALHPAGPWPHLELLGYRDAVTGPATAGTDTGTRTLTVWTQATDGAPARVVRDPDGHTHLLLPA